MRKILLTLMLLVAASATMSAHDFVVDGIYYKKLSDTTVAVTNNNGSNHSYRLREIIIPETIIVEGATYTVTNIYTYTFYDCSELKTLKIPKTVNVIATDLFRGCNGLEHIEVASDNSYYDSRGDCNAIIETATNKLIAGCKATIIPNTVTSIQNHAFYFLNTLTSIDIPNSVTSIGEYAFAFCYGLTHIEIPNSMTSICDNAFFCDTALTTIVIPNSITSIGQQAFCCCYQLTSLNIPESVTSISERAFSHCHNLSSIVVESGNPKYDSRNNCNAIIETASNQLVLGCNNTVIPNSVKKIGKYAFYEDINLTNITIPNSVTTIKEEAFYHCCGLTEMVLPNSLTSIGMDAFFNCTGLTSIRIPENMTVLTSRAFAACYGLTNVDISEGVHTIGSSAFIGCRNLKEVHLPSSLTTLKDQVFYSCKSLPSIDIPDKVTQMGDGVFENCDSLRMIICRPSIPPMASGKNKKIFTTDMIPSTATLFVPEDALEAYQSHEEWGRFLNIEVFETVEEEPQKTATPHVGEETQFTLSLENDESNPDAKIYYAFNGGDYWQEYTEPIEFNDFGHCYFENIRFYAIADGKEPSDTVDYDFYVHRYCYDFIVDGIYYLKTGAQTVSVSTEYDLRYRLYASTPACYAGDVSIPETVTWEGKTYTVTEVIPYAFYSSPRLTSVVIPNTVTTIGNDAFEQMFATDLTTVDIGNSVETIGVNCFYRCNMISRLICRAMTPPVLMQEDGNYGQSFSCYDTAVLYVPIEAVNAYRDDAEWGKFSHIVPFIGAGPGDVNGDGNIAINDVTNLIDMLLGGDELPAWADVNGDGNVTIADVTVLIDMLLGN